MFRQFCVISARLTLYHTLPLPLYNASQLDTPPHYTPPHSTPPPSTPLNVNTDGYGFKHNSTITVLDQVNGNKVGWPLGAILYEINSLPWELEQEVPREPWGKFFLAAAVGEEKVCLYNSAVFSVLHGALFSFFRRSFLRCIGIFFSFEGIAFSEQASFIRVSRICWRAEATV